MRYGRALSLALLTLLIFQSLAEAFMPLHMLAVRITDLRAGYVRTQGIGDTGYLNQKFVAHKYNLGVQQLSAHGWANAYRTEYQPRHLRGGAQIDNEIEQFSTRGGAHWMFDVMAGNTFCGRGCYQVLPLPRIGNESKAGENAPFKCVIFRQGDYIVDLCMAGTAATWTNVLALSRLVAGRIMRYG